MWNPNAPRDDQTGDPSQSCAGTVRSNGNGNGLAHALADVAEVYELLTPLSAGCCFPLTLQSQAPFCDLYVSASHSPRALRQHSPHLSCFWQHYTIHAMLLNAVVRTKAAVRTKVIQRGLTPSMTT
eukprot:6489578-Amphidinium_carterae.1